MAGTVQTDKDVALSSSDVHWSGANELLRVEEVVPGHRLVLLLKFLLPERARERRLLRWLTTVNMGVDIRATFSLDSFSKDASCWQETVWHWHASIFLLRAS